MRKVLALLLSLLLLALAACGLGGSDPAAPAAEVPAEEAPAPKQEPAEESPAPVEEGPADTPEESPAPIVEIPAENPEQLSEAPSEEAPDQESTPEGEEDALPGEELPRENTEEGPADSPEETPEETPAEESEESLEENPEESPEELPGESVEDAAGEGADEDVDAQKPAGDGKTGSGRSYVLKKVQLLDNELCTVTAVKVREDEDHSLLLELILENKTPDRDLSFCCENASMNGYMVPIFFTQLVSAGQKVQCTMRFEAEDLKDIGLDTMDELDFSLLAFNPADWTEDACLDEAFTLFPTGLYPEDISVPPRKTDPDEEIIHEDDDFSFVILQADPEGFWGYELKCFLENKTDTPLVFSWEDVHVNVMPVDPLWSQTVMPHSRLYCSVWFHNNALLENRIPHVDKVVFTLNASVIGGAKGFSFEKTFTYKPKL